jgi:hypothetical protein
VGTNPGAHVSEGKCVRFLPVTQRLTAGPPAAFHHGIGKTDLTVKFERAGLHRDSLRLN